jgi:Tol biopolymer transport system component
VHVDEQRFLSYSPDGTMVATFHQVEDKPDQICIYDVASMAEQVCGDLDGIRAGLRQEDVVWSPDNTKLAFGEESFRTIIDGDLWVMDAQTGEVTNVADDSFDGKVPLGEKTDASFSIDLLPAWRPDSAALAFSRSPYKDGGFAGNQIATVSLDGSAPTTLLTVSDEEPGVVYFGMRYATDGKHLLYTVSHSDPDNAENGLWIVDSDGKNPRQVIGNDPKLGPPVVVGVTPSGDKALVFYIQAAMQFSRSGSFYGIVDTETGDVTPVEVGLPDQSDPAFVSMATLSPDGTKLLTVTRLTDPEGIVAVRDVDGGNVEPVGEPIPDAGPAIVNTGVQWATNGTVFIPRGPRDATILEVEGGTSVATPVPVTEATPATSVANGDKIAPGSVVVTNDANVALRSAPSTSAPVVLELKQGTKLTVIGPEVLGDGFRWWPVMEPESQTIGYVRAELVSLA